LLQPVSGMIPKPSPAVDPLTPEAPSLSEPMPTPTASASSAPPLRCIQRPTGEWFTFAVGNAIGKDTPDATELLTETEARERLESAGLTATQIDARLTAARATPEISGDELPLPDPVVGSSTAGGSPTPNGPSGGRGASTAGSE
jgi:hypothetical protein